jgi:hypothetical protein
MLTGNTYWAQDKIAFKNNLMLSIKNCLCPYKVDENIFKNGFEKAFDHADKDFDNLRARLLGLTLWHVFNGSELWISSHTPSGSIVPDEVLINAYVTWRKARNFAKKHGADAIMASTVMEEAVHITADKLAKNLLLRNVGQYMFGIYCKRLMRSINPSDFNSRKIKLSEDRLSDSGAAADAMENRIFAQEMLDLMPERVRVIALLRHYWGYEWTEIAERLGMSVNAAKKTLTVGFRKTREKYEKNHKVTNKQ